MPLMYSRKRKPKLPIPWETFREYPRRLLLGVLGLYGFFKLLYSHEWLAGFVILSLTSWIDNGFKNPWKRKPRKARKLSRTCMAQHSRPRGFLGIKWKFASSLKPLLVFVTLITLRLHLAHRRRIARTRDSLQDALKFFGVTMFLSLVLFVGVSSFWGVGIKIYFDVIARSDEPLAFAMFGSSFLSLLPAFYGFGIFSNTLLYIGWFGGDRQAVKRVLEAALVVIVLYGFVYYYLVYSGAEVHFSGIREESKMNTMDFNWEKWLTLGSENEEAHRHQIATLVDCVYYSAMVLVTGGVEGIQPVSTVGKALTVSEMMIGWFFLVICISAALGRERRFIESSGSSAATSASAVTAPPSAATSPSLPSSPPISPARSQKKQSKDRNQKRRR